MHSFKILITNLSSPTSSLPLSNTLSIPLFKAFPRLEQQIPHISFCNLPTPVEKLSKLSDQLHISLYVKRDDLSGKLGNIFRYYGGNKARKLEFELANALQHSAKTIITLGCAGSNHAVATSEYCNLNNLTCICILKPQAKTPVVTKNLLLHQTNGTKLHYVYNQEQLIIDLLFK